MSIQQRLMPSAAQTVTLLEHCQQTRFIWNISLEQRGMWTEQRRFYSQKINFATQSRELTELRAELDWLRAGSTVCQQGALRDIDTAFTNFFA
jgi:putative transposase